MICRNCLREKQIDLFRLRLSRGKQRREVVCKACESKRNTEYQKHKRRTDPNFKKKLYARKTIEQRKRRTGFSADLFRQRMAEQKGRCGICAVHMVSPNADHNHLTKQCRGLLCGHCNRALGLFKEDINILASAISYLEHYR